MINPINAEELTLLWHQQMECWESARLNYEALAQVEERIVELGEITVCVQYNPGRMTSVSSRSNSQTAPSACFLCNENLPAEQLRIPYMSDYHLLVNPFPIFKQHFTIPTTMHTPQCITQRMDVLLALSRDCAPYTFFYNGARCGASAPMHMHFQAGNGGFMPIEQQWYIAHRRAVRDTKHARLSLLEGLYRPIFLLEATKEEAALALWERLYHALPEIPDEEPMINIIARYQSSEWILLIFPRTKHRPDRYYATDATQRLISPGSVEMGGVIITPRPEDYATLTAKEIADIYAEVTPQEEIIHQIIKLIK